MNNIKNSRPSPPLSLVLRSRIHFPWVRLCLILLLLPSLFLYGQKIIVPSKEVRVIACVKEDKVILRWAPTSALSWEFANKYGYTIERYLMVKDGKPVKPQREVLTSLPLKPKPLSAWAEAYKTDSNKYIAIGSQALYGETFKIDTKAGNLYQVITKAKESESRFGFALFCADQSLTVAELSGLRWTDTKISKGEKYLYRVYANVPHSIQKIDTGNVFVDAGKVTEYPMPRILKANFGNRTVKLEWDNRFFHDLYTGWFIERSSDNIHWGTRNKEPFINFSEDRKPLETLTYIDSIPQNNTPYYFRLKARTYFGEIEGPSTVAKGQGKNPLNASPVITSIQQVDKKTIQISWELTEDNNPNILEFRLYRGSKSKGPFKLLKTVKAAGRTILITDPQSVNYFFIAAFGVDSTEYRSMSSLFQLEDETPPSPPTGLKGTIDSNGVVTVSWKKNTEEDLYGYKIFMANRPHQEFSNLTRRIKTDTVFTDTIPLHNLAKKIYYKVSSVDNHFNVSDYSAIIEIRKPDKIAPSCPVFSKAIANDTAIFLSWFNSSSEDLVGHILYRTIAGADEWKVIASFDTIKSKKGAEQSYTDKDKTLGKKTYYQYVVIAVDEDKNESSFEQNVKMKLIDNGVRPALENITYEADRETNQVVLKWKYTSEGVDRILVYKSKKEEPLTLYKSVLPGTDSFTDSSVQINTRYTYRLKAKHKDGGSSPMSPQILIQF